MLEDNLKALIKPQYVDHIPKALKGAPTVNEMIDQRMERDNKEEIIEALQLREVLTREVQQLSGGELQRFAIASRPRYLPSDSLQYYTRDISLLKTF